MIAAEDDDVVGRHCYCVYAVSSEYAEVVVGSFYSVRNGVEWNPRADVGDCIHLQLQVYNTTTEGECMRL